MTKKEDIINYYNQLDRSYFMEEHKERANIDTPLPIGYGQTISQPSLVLKMTLLLDIEKDNKVLEIGTGSGFQTALLSKASKAVYTIERIEELYEKAKSRLDKAGYKNISYKLDDGSIGWKEYAPYDRIMVTASSSLVPDELIEQLSINGKMIIPVGPKLAQDLLLISKDEEGKVKKEFIDKVRFVRLVGKYE